MIKKNKLNSIIVLGLVAIIGILVAQLLWTKQAYSIEEKKFSQRVHIALLEVAKKLYEGTNHELPAENPVQKVSNDYYIVNIDNDFEPKILDFYLKSEFEKVNINTDYEYAMYNCESDEMVYGNYVSMSEVNKQKPSVYFPKHKNLVYYFAIRFPNETSFLFSSLKFWFVLSFALIIILLVYVYSIVTILQQKRGVYPLFNFPLFRCKYSIFIKEYKRAVCHSNDWRNLPNPNSKSLIIGVCP